MKLLTLNCHSWQEENQVEKIKYLANVIKEKQYDVIALQEVSQRIDANSVDSKIKEDNFEIPNYIKEAVDFLIKKEK